MREPGRERALYRFDDVVLDLGAFRLTRGGQKVHLEPKVLELLGYLVANRGRLVEKPELMAAVWRDTAVSDSALARAVAQLRKALEDDAREARYVETVPTRGYRFRAEVAVQEGRNGESPSLVSEPEPRPSEPLERTPAGLESAPADPAPAPRRVAPYAAAVAALALVGLALALGPFSTRPAEGPAPPAPREAHRILVSTTRGYNGFPTFSPDGATMAFASDHSGRLEIQVRPLAPGGRQVAVTSDGQDNVQPAWSPDGRYIAYHSMRRGGLWLMPALGGAARQISEFGFGPAWSPDARRIVFSSLGLAALEGGAQYGAALWTVDVADGEPAKPRRLTEPGRPPSGHGAPVFSPDGRHVFFVADGIWSVRSDGTESPRLVLEASAADLALSPDGRSLYWSGWQRSNWRLWRAFLDPSSLRAGPPEEILNTGDQAPRHLTTARDGRLAFTLASTSSDLVLLPLDTRGHPAGPAREAFPGASGRKVTLHFAPDGRSLAFARTQAGQGMEVWALDVATGETRALLPRTDTSFFNGWFPDGSALLVTGRLGGAKGLLQAPLSGRNPTVLFATDSIGWARLMPSGREIVFHAVSEGVLAVHRAKLDGSAAVRLSNDPLGVGWPVPRPDGRTLAVELFRGHDVQLGLLPADGGTARPLTREPGQHWCHDWSPDGRRVLFAGRRDSLWNIYWMDVRTGEERRLTDHRRVRDSVRTPTWSPRGDLVAYERIEATGAVWVLDWQPPAASRGAANRAAP